MIYCPLYIFITLGRRGCGGGTAMVSFQYNWRGWQSLPFETLMIALSVSVQVCWGLIRTSFSVWHKMVPMFHHYHVGGFSMHPTFYSDPKWHIQPVGSLKQNRLWRRTSLVFVSNILSFIVYNNCHLVFQSMLLRVKIVEFIRNSIFACKYSVVASINLNVIYFSVFPLMMIEKQYL